MLRTLLAGSALASAIGFSAMAQSTTDPAADPAKEPAPAMAPAAPMTPAAEAPVLMPIEVGTLSADDLIGAAITNPDGETIASVDDALMTPEGQLENVVAKFGGFLGFGSNTVLLAPAELQFFHDDGGNLVVQTMLTPEALKDRPDYVPSEG